MRLSWRSVLTTALDIAAAACVVAGVALIYAPAAFIAAGAALCVVSWRLASDTDAETPE